MAKSKKASTSASEAAPMDVDVPASGSGSGSLSDDPAAAALVSDSSTSAPVDSRRLVQILHERVGNVSSTDFPLHHPGEVNAGMGEELKVVITRLSDATCEFDLVGVDASIANAIRRVLIAEVPTVAIEHVYVWNNTSIIQDEVLSHRLGLVPLKINPDKIELREPGAEADDSNTVVFHLKAKCERNPRAAKGETDPDKLYIGHNVYSSQLKWDPKGGQQDEFAHDPPRAVHDRILLAKLRPGQELDLELHCEKGIGKDHAKFSPVATATYRLLPHITLHHPIPEPLADRLIACFSPGVLGRHPSTGQVQVQDARRETMAREVHRHPELDPLVAINRVRDHFLFEVESSGIIPAQDLVPASIRTLRSKINDLRESLNLLESSGAAVAR